MVDAVAGSVVDVSFDAMAQQDTRCSLVAETLPLNTFPAFMVRDAPRQVIILALLQVVRLPGLGDVAAAHVHFAPRLFIIVKVPLAQEPQRSHAEGHNGRHGAVQLVEARGAEHGAVAAKRGNDVDLVGNVGLVVGNVQREAEVLLDRLGDARLDNDVDVAVLAVDVTRKLDDGLGDVGRVELLDEEEVARGPRPVEHEERGAWFRALQVARVCARGQLRDTEAVGRRGAERWRRGEVSRTSAGGRWETACRACGGMSTTVGENFR